ncbi:MAG: UDP-N-acetylglucosamine 1-carboxyvinyltransferase [Pseudomonadota bacterium]|nr:UDP-N-acetylglucosamine 1-carboxyvinyltransferase [Pseudomonadota bacterium]QKK06475.1 MAG: UDP-N-acetylglucosamine 1-carboxyvinyltransferase [Pseudomonadota bacterium]
MDKLEIEGGYPLNGEITISGAKNAALPLMCAALLSADTLVLENVPELHDILSLIDLLENMGAKTTRTGTQLAIDAAPVNSTTAPYDLVRKMRASVLVLGPLLARFGTAKVSLPGGCAIGTRPVDLHIEGLRKMGAEIELKDGYIHARTPQGGLKGAEITFRTKSVGATENLLMAATLAKGRTVLHNAALEPEITDLADCLIAMGAKITGLGTETLEIEGVEALSGASHSVIPDRIETGTYAIAAAMTGGEVTLKHARLDHLEALVPMLETAGVSLKDDGKGNVTVTRKGNTLNAVDITTAPYPGFPTDLQAQAMAMLTIAEGAGTVKETIFENRFMHVPELARMGADIAVHGSSAVVRGVPRLKGAEVMATDLRASVSLILAALAADGTTVVNRIYHLDRGYEKLEQKLGACGAKLQRVAA